MRKEFPVVFCNYHLVISSSVINFPRTKSRLQFFSFDWVFLYLLFISITVSWLIIPSMSISEYELTSLSCEISYFSLSTKYIYRDHFVHAPNKWETTLHGNVVIHWPGAYTKWPLHIQYMHSQADAILFTTIEYTRPVGFSNVDDLVNNVLKKSMPG